MSLEVELVASARAVAERLVAGIRVADDDLMRLVNAIVAHDVVAGNYTEAQRTVVEGNMGVDLHGLAGVSVTSSGATFEAKALVEEPVEEPVKEEEISATPEPQEPVVTAPESDSVTSEVAPQSFASTDPNSDSETSVE